MRFCALRNAHITKVNAMEALHTNYNILICVSIFRLKFSDHICPTTKKIWVR
eukprot:COSAG05_NODE_630_length_8210_cov_5.004563_5_plen_52_part_00